MVKSRFFSVEEFVAILEKMSQVFDILIEGLFFTINTIWESSYMKNILCLAELFCTYKRSFRVPDLKLGTLKICSSIL